MSDPIEYLNERDDVAKTEYTRRHVDKGRVTVELWHDAEGLQAIFQKAMDGVVSPRGLQEYAKERALAKRETTVDTRVQWRDLASLYPETVKRMEEDDAN